MRARLILAPLAFVVLVIAMVSGCGEDVAEPVNESPIVDVIPDTTVFLGDSLLGQVVASDEELDALTYSMTVLPKDGADDVVVDAGIDPVTGEYWFVPTEGDLPARTLRFTVTDENGTATSTDFHVTVTYDVDQSNIYDLTYGDGGVNVGHFAPMGQEFRPEYRWLDVIELALSTYTPSMVFVRIRDGSITGTVVAESELLVLPTSYSEFVMALFHFERVTLVPRHLYVFEIVPVDGVVLVRRNGDLYARGRSILSGAVTEDMDLWFQEGLLPRPAQAPPIIPHPRTGE